MLAAAVDRTRFLQSDASTLLQRILLVTDGTVTHLLETFAGERICVIKLRQSIDQGGRGVDELEVSDRHQVLHREVLLVGCTTRRAFLYAASQIVPDRLDPAVRQGLLESSKPIGYLLEESRTETYRQILDARREPAASCASYFGIDAAAEVLTRTYRVFAGGRPIMLITETFPADAFLLDGLGLGTRGGPAD